MRLVSSSTILTKDTPPGFFLSLTGLLFWVFDSVHGRVAVQLSDHGSVPQFAYLYLEDEHHLEGHWCGSVRLFRGPAIEATQRGHCGVIQTYRGLVYLKANAPTGAGEYLRILDYRDAQSSDWRKYSHHWRLLSDTFHSELMFFEQMGRSPRMRQYQEDYLDWQ